MLRISTLFGAALSVATIVAVPQSATAASISVRYGFTATDFSVSGVGMAAPEEVKGEVALTFTPLQDIGLINGPNPFVFDDIVLSFAGFTYTNADLATVIGVRNARTQFNYAAGVNGGDFNGRFEITGANCFQSQQGVGSCGDNDFFLRFTDRGQAGPDFVQTFEQFVATGFYISTSANQRFTAGDLVVERLSASIDGVAIETGPTTTVPLPAPALMLGSALLGLAGFNFGTRRRKGAISAHV